MKLKSFFICILVATPQVFAETKSIQKLKDPDPIYVIERCAVNSFQALNIVKSMQNKRKEEVEFEEVMLKRFNFFVDTLINYHQDQDKFLSKEEITTKILNRITDLVKIVGNYSNKSDFFDDMKYCKSMVKYNKK